jgi:hypothetical protein
MGGDKTIRGDPEEEKTVTTYKKGLNVDILGKVVISGDSTIGIVEEDGGELHVRPFLIDGNGMGSDIENYEENPLIILEIEEAEQLFQTVLEHNRAAGILTREAAKVGA